MQYVTLRQAASTLQVTAETIRNLCVAGKLPHIRVGKSYRLPADFIEHLTGGPVGSS